MTKKPFCKQRHEYLFESYECRLPKGHEGEHAWRYRE